MVVVLALSSCVQSKLSVCGDATCPLGDVCAAGGQCASPDDIAACDGQADGEACIASNGGTGACSGGACSTGSCGNGTVDGNELCDDGNRDSGDGCRADCSKLERCGDLIVDDGEACDDGNSNAVDGCDDCKSLRWNASALVGSPAAATTAQFNSPEQIAIDVLGRVYVADTQNHRVYRIGLDGNITVIAGTGTSGFSGDGGSAISAKLSFPRGVAVDGLGQVFIADVNNNRIRRVDMHGRIETIAGTGVAAYSGDGIAAINSALNYPVGVAVDGIGQVYIADNVNNRIRRIGSDGNITTIANTSYPRALTLDSQSRLYIVDYVGSKILRLTNGNLETFAGTGVPGSDGDGELAVNAQLRYPSGQVAIDSIGRVYIADSYNHRIRRVNLDGKIETVAGTGSSGYSGDNGVATNATLNVPSGVAVDSSNQLYIADTFNKRIRRINSNGDIVAIAGAALAVDKTALAAKLNYPGAVTYRNGQLFIADSINHRIQRVNTDGTVVNIAGTGDPGISGDGPANSARLNYPSGIAVDAQGVVYIADSANNVIRRVSPNGTMTTIAGNGTSGFNGDGRAATDSTLSYPIGVALDAGGFVYIADTYNNRIRRINQDGTMTTVAGTGSSGATGDRGPAVAATFSLPHSIAFDGVGQMYIADSQNSLIRRISLGGTIETVAGKGPVGLNSPSGVAVDGSGRVLIADTFNNVVRRVNSDGSMETVAGTGSDGAQGDFGVAMLAGLNHPSGVATDEQGRIIIADTFNNRIRRVNIDGTIETIAGAVLAPNQGPVATGRIGGARAMVRTPDNTTFVANGNSGIVERIANGVVEQVAGRYQYSIPRGNLARFRGAGFGNINGIAWDDSAQLLYLTESTASSNRVHAITMADPSKPDTWTIATLVNDSGIAGFADGSAGAAQLRDPTGLWLDVASRTLYIADTGNHAIRALDLSTRTVTTIVNAAHSLGFAGDDGAAAAALLYQPQAVTRCSNGDIFVADTGNNRIRRVAAATGLITTVIGDGVPASSGQGAPATIFPVDTPLGLACDAANNLFVASSTTVRLLSASASGIVDGSGPVQTIYGVVPHASFPASETSCLTGILSLDPSRLQVADSCSGLLVELHNQAR
jgi:cysteine-rich repeat protein